MTTRKPKSDAQKAMGSTRFTLPWPPSANQHWRSVTIRGRARVLLSKAGREYRSRVAGAVVGLPRSHDHGGRLCVSINLCPPDRRKIDVDNRIKPLLDALTEADVWGDDEQVDELHVYRDALHPGGRAVVEISDA
jgi:crossover junction endodeoxyribonuclease RusA